MTTTPNKQTTASLPGSAEPAAPTLGIDAPQVAPNEPRTHEFGRIDKAETVYVREGESERMIGACPKGVPAEPFVLYEHRFADLGATVKLFEGRLATLSPKDIDSTLEAIRQAVEAPQTLDSLAALHARIEAVVFRAVERREWARAERTAAREEALGAQAKVVKWAEEIVAQDPKHTHWKHSGQKLCDLFEEWKSLQRKGLHLDKSTENELWERFSAARTQFGRHRRQYFSALDQVQSEAKRIGEVPITGAEVLQTSADWGAASETYREPIDRWKAVPRAFRKGDDALWARFHTAQQVFFDTHRAKDETMNLECRENLLVKETLAGEAERILLIENLEAAKTTLRSIRGRRDEMGYVLSLDLHRTEERLRTIETAIRDAEGSEWRRSNPETRARVQGMLGQLESQLAPLRVELETAEERGDGRRARSLSEAIGTKRAWLA